MSKGIAWTLVLSVGLWLCAGAALAGDDAKKEEGAKKVSDATKLAKDGVTEYAQGTAAEAEKGVTGFFKGLPWFSSPVALVLGFLLGFVGGRVGGKGGPKKPGPPGGDKKE
jgi:hypothetical protein